MYKKINITENTLKVLSLFTQEFDGEYYVREIGNLLNLSPRTGQLILEDLEEKGVLESKTRGKIKMFRLNSGEITKRYLILAEQYKLISFLEEKTLVREILEKIASHIEGIGIVFGSYVKNLEKKSSDLDVFIAGKCNEEEIKKISKNFGMEINIKCYPMKTFEKSLGKDILLKEILKNHMVFSGSEQFIQKVFK